MYRKQKKKPLTKGGGKKNMVKVAEKIAQGGVTIVYLLYKTLATLYRRHL